MGKLLGSHSDNSELDRPDLNKCPDCECLFPQDTCPICGKVCPPGYRAGERKPEKKKREKSKIINYNFVAWYHKWWFIILMLLLFPLCGVVLILTSPHRKSTKIIVFIIALIYSVVSYFGIGNIIISIKNTFENPVDTSLSYEEYIGKCKEISLEEYYRNPDDFEGEFVRVELVIAEKIFDSEIYYQNGKYPEYYLCYFEINGQKMIMFIRDCVQNNSMNFVKGDRITVYGECSGMKTIYDLNYNSRTGCCVNGAYIHLEK